MAKRLFIKTYGCQMNVYDSDRMTRMLAPLGYAPVDTPDGADMVVLNTCHIREKASEKVFSELGRLRVLKEERRRAGDDLLVAVAGCVAQAEGEEIARRAPHVDIVVGPQSYHRLPELIARTSRAAGREVALETQFDVEAKFDSLADDATQAQGAAAFLTVQEGCDKFCTFCVVPYTRGAEYSRPAADILRDARALVANGTVEITLLGQNVNAWHGAGPDGSDWTFGRLVRALAQVDGLARIRYTTSHPLEMTADLIAAHGEVPQLMPYLHLPVQSGSDRILRAMNRRHDRAAYFRIVERLRAARPDLALSSDFIVGFPGETDADFADTLDLVARTGFAQAYSFKYSPRPGTPAAAIGQQVDEALKTERLQALQATIDAGQRVFNAATVGRVLPVLLEREGRHPGQLLGRSPYMQAVHVDAPLDLLGKIADVSIERGLSNSLAGRLAGPVPSGVAA